MGRNRLASGRAPGCHLVPVRPRGSLGLERSGMPSTTEPRFSSFTLASHDFMVRTRGLKVVGS